MKFSAIVAGAFTFGSAFAAPVPHKKPVKETAPVAGASISQMMTLVSGLKSQVEADIASLPVAGQLTAEAVPMVRQTLQTVHSDVQTAVSSLTPMVMGIAMPLADAEIEHVMTVVQDVTSMVGGVQSTLEGLVGGVAGDVVIMIHPEVSMVMSVVGGVANPVLGMVSGLVGGIGGNLPIVGDLLAATNGLRSAASGLLAPVTGVLSTLGLGVSP